MDSPFLRTELLLGSDAIDRLRRSRVCVFGLGGVGGYAVEALVRSGIGALDIVDNDTVDITNLNRQLIALRSTIGRAKTDVCRERILDINPECIVTAHRMFYLPENADAIDLSQMNFVVDCIDTMSAKLELVRRCHDLGIPLISCMGTARKLDPTRLRISDITRTNTDPLAKVLRRKLRDLGISHLKCVWSDEMPAQQPDKESPLPSCTFVPATAGILIACEVVMYLASNDNDNHNNHFNQ